MTRVTTSASILLIIIISMNSIGVGSGYAADITPALDSKTTVIWEVLETPSTAFQSFWTGGGYWIAQKQSNMTFVVGDIQEDVTGFFFLGNMTVYTNDTMISRDLALGVWGAVEFSPGLFIKIDSASITELNSTAFEAVERIQWNYLNGTMVSYYDNYSINDVEHQCIVFEYQQDPTIVGTPQHTQLIYSLSTGILLYANTSYYFGAPYRPYHLEIKFSAIKYLGATPNLMILYLSVFIVVLVIIVGIRLQRRRP